jgi:hypothetical protein
VTLQGEGSQEHGGLDLVLVIHVGFILWLVVDGWFPALGRFDPRGTEVLRLGREKAG